MAAAADDGSVGFVPPLNEVKLPVPGEKNVLITSALPYVNNVPHLGNIIGCVLSADVYARYLRQRKVNSIYICGTDEYGTATETKALAEGLTPQEICDKYNAIHQEVYEWFDIRFDYFGRTTTEQQTAIGQDIYLKLRANGYLEEQSVTQLFCGACSKFLADRYVEGECPGCKYPDARGDQCDNCGSLLNPTELVNPRCKICSATPETKSSDHVFLDLEKLSPEITEWFNNTKEPWTANTIGITQSWLTKGLHPRCITRDLSWGTPVPEEKFAGKVFYVWFDAPIGYISITANYTSEWEKWWKNPEDVELVQFMGKDNVPFHTVMFPASLIGSGDGYTIVNNVSTTEYLNYGQAQFSKSRGTGVFGDNVRDSGIPAEVWRYYLLVNRPESSDSYFDWDDFLAKNNNELLNNLGNFVNRALKFVHKADTFDAVVPELGTVTEREEALVAEVNTLLGEYTAAFDKVKIKDALRTALRISGAGNVYLQDCQPWKLVKTDKERCATVVRVGLELTVLLASLVAPFMPAVATKIIAMLALSVDGNDECHPYIPSEFNIPSAWFPAGHKIGTPETLFRPLGEEDIARLIELYGSTAPPPNEAVVAAEAAISAQQSVIDSLKKLKGDKKSLDAAKNVLGFLRGHLASVGGGSGDGGAGGDGKADKKSKKKQAQKAKGKAAEKIPDNACPLNIRVGRVLTVTAVPDSDKLYELSVDVGEDAPRNIIAGLQTQYTAEQLQDRLVCALCNLKTAKLAGRLSDGMLLCATADDESFGLLAPPEGAAVGEPALREGDIPWDFEKRLNSKQFKKNTLAITASGSVALNEGELTIGGTPVTPDPTKGPYSEGATVR